jgi:hypothetical protein
MAQIDIVTKDDLELFKLDLIREITALLKRLTRRVHHHSFHG